MESKATHPGKYVREKVIPEGMSVTKAAKTMGIGRPALSNFLNGNAALSPEMASRLQRAFGADADHLIRRQAEYDAERRRSDRVVSATAGRFVPPFLMATANDIQGWADTHRSRYQLAVLLRILINSTCDGLEFIDFPGNDDAQRRGWDGKVKTTAGNPWVPEGESRWEFGTDQRIANKANNDYAKRTAATDEAERRRLAFVFLTPRRWHGKESWLDDRRSEGKWRDVRAWDASDLEQWLEQSVPAQVWFSGQSGQTFRGVKSLERCWVEWCADCQPCFTADIFGEAISAFGQKVLDHLRSDTREVLRIIADSRQEALAYIYAVLWRSDELTGLNDRLVVFTKPGTLSELAAGSPGFIPVIADSAVEAELAQSGRRLKALVVDHRTAVRDESGISLEPLSHEGFRESLASMGLRGDEIDRLDRESGRSLTVLRRRLARSVAIRTPNWCTEAELALSLAPMAFAGAWIATNEADRYLVGELANRDYDQLEVDFTRLLNLEDSPVWSVGDYRGVVSKVDALYGVAGWIDVEMIDRFLEVAEVVLSERDPALDAPEDEQWASSREISSPLRKGVGESMVLLAIHGSRLFGNRMAREPDSKVAELVGRLLEPMTADKLLSQSSNLTLYAEAAPDAFLGVFRRDMDRPEPVVSALMQPTGDILFGRSDRVDLLWALELLAWRPEWLDQVVDLLAKLTKLEPDDNLGHKPSESLLSIFRSWMPQTAAVVQHRIAILDHLASEHPKIAWRIATAQFDPAQRVGNYAHKPIWRDYAVGHGEPVTNGEMRDFVLHCIDSCVSWPCHTRETLADLLASLDWMLTRHLAGLGDAIAEWASSASDSDRAWLRERIRVSMRRSIRRKRKDKRKDVDERVSTARRAFEILEPRDPVWKHAWLFAKPWVEESWDEVEDDVDIRARDESVRRLRSQAVKEVWTDLGGDGVLQLAFSGEAPEAVGRSLSEVVENPEGRLSFARTVVRNGDLLTSRRHQLLLSGWFGGMGSGAAILVAQDLWDEATTRIGVMLLCLAGFERTVWESVEAIGGTVARQYWERVEPSWRLDDDEDINYAVSRLLEASRPLAAFDFAHLDWGRVESRHIHAILASLPDSDEVRHGSRRLDAHYVQRALQVLGERSALTRIEMARLELLYLDLFWLDEDGVPNLEREVEAKPELFCEAVTLAYRREDRDEDCKPTQGQRSSALRAHRLLNKLSYVPGHDDDGYLNAGRLTKWIRKVQELCDTNGRRRMGDHHIGQLLSRAPADEDGVWPCQPVREALDTVLNEDIGRGFHIGRQNSRGPQWRGEGGGQERELADQYEEWAKESDYSYPKVAAALRALASAYRSEGRWWDQEAAIQQRLGY